MSPHATRRPLELVVARDARALAGLAADRLARELSARAADLQERRGAALDVALSGGRTPRACYEALARDVRVPWGLLRVWLGDERAVDPTSPDSNARLLRETLQADGTLRPDQIHAPLAAAPRTHADTEAAAADYGRRLPERFDVLLLGLGADGHVASLFPRSPALAEERRRCVAVRAPVDPVERLTITPALIASAGAVLVLVSGAAKAQAVARALEGEWDPAQCPGQLARGGTWLVDLEAAAALRRPHANDPTGAGPRGRGAP
jgi:6-phosphogluconolactonase